MKKLQLLIFLLFITCAEQPEEKIQWLNGYWEIERVVAPNGTTKDYTFNETVDYIYVENNKGFRKKLQPRFNNQFITSEDSEALNIKIEGDSLNLYYKTELTNWKETVLKANEDRLEIVNSEGLVYIYKRYEPINLSIDEE